MSESQNSDQVLSALSTEPEMSPSEENPQDNGDASHRRKWIASAGWTLLLGRFARQLNWSLIATILAIKALIFIFALQSYPALTNKSVPSGRGWLEIWNHWDSERYLHLAQFGYTDVGIEKYEIVGFPLYPWIVRGFAFVFHDYLVSGFIVSGIASIAAGLLLDKLVRIDYPESDARAAVWFMFIFPTSYFLHINYTESLFIALTLGCFLAARQKQWRTTGILGALTCLTRINGLVIVPALLAEAFLQYRETRRWHSQWLWILVSPLGFGCYLLLNKIVTGNWFAFISANRENFHKWFAPPWIGVKDTFKLMWSNPPEYAQMVGAQEFIFIVIGAVAIIASFRLLRPAYTVWIAGNWLLFTSVGFILGVPRYTLTLFPLFILLALLAKKPFWSHVITVWSLLFLALFINQFIQGHWAFG